MWIQVYLNLAPWTAWLLCLWMRRTDSNASLQGERLVLLKRWSLNGVKMDSEGKLWIPTWVSFSLSVQFQGGLRS